MGHFTILLKYFIRWGRKWKDRASIKFMTILFYVYLANKEYEQGFRESYR